MSKKFLWKIAIIALAAFSVPLRADGYDDCVIKCKDNYFWCLMRCPTAGCYFKYVSCVAKCADKNDGWIINDAEAIEGSCE